MQDPTVLPSPPCSAGFEGDFKRASFSSMASTAFASADDLFPACFAAAPALPAVCHGEVEKLGEGDEPVDPSDGDDERESSVS